MKNVLETKNLRKKYSRTSFVLNDVSIYVPEGEVVGLIGENGAGKTTLISLILDQISADSGNIQLFGSSRIGSKSIKGNIGFVIDECCYHSCLSSSEIGNILKYIYNQWNNDLYKDFLRKFGIDPRKRISEMSKGMKSKMMLSAALAHSPQLLILDEITSGLDPIVRDDILHILKEYVSETSNAVFFSTHITSDLDKIADRVAFLHEGSLIFEEDMKTLKTKYILYTCPNLNAPAPEDHSIVAQYSEFDNAYYLLDKDKTSFSGRIPTIDDIMLLYIKGREIK